MVMPYFSCDACGAQSVQFTKDWECPICLTPLLHGSASRAFHRLNFIVAIDRANPECGCTRERMINIYSGHNRIVFDTRIAVLRGEELVIKFYPRTQEKMITIVHMMGDER